MKIRFIGNINIFVFDKLQYIFIFILLSFLVITVRPTMGNTDDIIRYNDIILMISGKMPISKYSIVQEIISIPLYYMGPISESSVRVIALNTVLFLVTMIGIERITQNNIGIRFNLLIITASMFPIAMKGYGSEPLTAMAMTLGVLLLEFSQKRWLSALLFTFGIANTPAAIPAYALAIIYFAFRKKDSKYLLFLPLPALAFCAEEYLKFGSIFLIPYLQESENGAKTIMPYSGLPGFSYPFWLGFLSILFSFGKGLIFFVPALLLRWTDAFARIPERFRLVVDVWLVFVLGLVLVYAKWWAWYGGFCWGPRFFLFACIPACCMLAFITSEPVLTKRDAWLTGFVLALSVWGCLVGYAYGLDARDGWETCIKDDYALDMLCWYTPEWSPLWRNLVVGFRPLDWAHWIYVASSAAFNVAILISLVTKTISSKTRRV